MYINPCGGCSICGDPHFKCLTCRIACGAPVCLGNPLEQCAECYFRALPVEFYAGYLEQLDRIVLPPITTLPDDATFQASLDDASKRRRFASFVLSSGRLQSPNFLYTEGRLDLFMVDHMYGSDRETLPLISEEVIMGRRPFVDVKLELRHAWLTHLRNNDDHERRFAHIALDGEKYVEVPGYSTGRERAQVIHSLYIV